MPHGDKDEGGVIPAELIRETVMPPYFFQELQYSFGSASSEDQPAAAGKDPDKPSETKDEV